MELFSQTLTAGFETFGLETDISAIKKYEKYYELLTAQNAVMNLTAITGERETASLHFLDSAALLKIIDFTDKSVIDVGTGAGFPGLVLKIALPGIGLTLLDSLNKRIDFLKKTCAELELCDVRCLHARAEELGSEHKSVYDVAVSRAVARLNTLCELCMPLVRVGGVFLAMKGPEPSDELEEASGAIRLLGGEISEIREYEISGAPRSVVVIKKIHETPEKYPRRFARIQKNPL